MTDDVRLPDPFGAMGCLPRGSLVIVRSQVRERRIELARLLPQFARSRGLVWTIADDPPLASEAGADGVHFPEVHCRVAAHWRALRPRWIITCAAHSLSACARAARARADAVLLSPVFTTMSHQGQAALGLFRANRIAAQAGLPVYALGGIDARCASRLQRGAFAGIAAIGALAATTQPRRAPVVAPRIW